MIRRLFSAAILFALVAAPALADESYVADLAHSSAGFSARHLLITNVRGSIPIKEATMTTASGSSVPTSLGATLDATGLNTANERRDNDLRSPNFLDVTKFPTIVFKSTKITPGNDGAFTVVGDLTIHGVTKPVTLAGKMLGTATDGRGRKHIGYTASGTIDRRDFGISFMGSMGGALIAGTDVTLEIESEMVSR